MKYIIDMPEGWKPGSDGCKLLGICCAGGDFQCSRCPLAGAKEAKEVTHEHHLMGVYYKDRTEWLLDRVPKKIFAVEDK